MHVITDPITGEILELYSARGESEMAFRAEVDSTIMCLMHEYGITWTEAYRRLQNSDAMNPITYRDQVFWVE